jgi:hypothetical protein
MRPDAKVKPRRSKRVSATSDVALSEAMVCEVEDLIRQRAYFLWEDEGRPQGRETDHWHRARTEVQKELQR